jgi:hypothetical protein
LLVVIAMVGLEGCGTLLRTDPSRWAAPDALLKPRHIYEECVPVEDHQVLEYAFTASKPVEFNIHYHLGEEPAYPVLEKGVASLQGVFDPSTVQDPMGKPPFYCLMWRNTQREEVKLNFSFTVRDR